MRSIIILYIALVGAWLTHIVSCLLHGKYMLLIAGAFIFPVGVIHGIGLWFGIDW